MIPLKVDYFNGRAVLLPAPPRAGTKNAVLRVWNSLCQPVAGDSAGHIPLKLGHIITSAQADGPQIETEIHLITFLSDPADRALIMSTQTIARFKDGSWTPEAPPAPLQAIAIQTMIEAVVKDA